MVHGRRSSAMGGVLADSGERAIRCLRPTEIRMKAEVFVTLKRGVLDPQGKAIHHAIETNGFEGVADVRQGKFFEIELGDGLSVEDARVRLEKISHEILANPVIEDFRVELKQ